MSMQYDQQEKNRPSNHDFLGVIYMACNVHATCIAVFLRRGFGKEALAWNGFLAFWLLILLGGGDVAFLYYFACWLVALIAQRIRTLAMLRKGVVIHTRYAGYPYWAMKVPFVRSEDTAMGFVEPAMCFIAGALLCPLSVNIGGFVMLGVITFMVRHGIDEEIDRKRLERLQDNAIETMWYAEQMRKRR